MYETLLSLLQDDDFTVVESFDIPGVDASFAEVPRFLLDSQIGPWLNRWPREMRSGESGLWAHQAQALEALGRGENVVISTGTASGKSLVFRAIALYQVLRDPDSRVIVFYPLKALVADQLVGWREMARGLNLEEEIIGRIDGDVPAKEREDILQRARIVVMTPDVCHAWMMSRLSTPAVKNFVRSLSILVMDEAHTLEGVFGSNFAFLIRRVSAARNHVLGDQSKTHPLQMVAATATISNPGEHLRRLTGASFSVVDHQMDGAPQYHRTIAHIACPAGEERTVVKELQRRVLVENTTGAFITFVDSRKGVESLAIATQQEAGELLGSSGVFPYRAGYHGSDRQQIEQRLRDGDLRGVVSTSALELGIDIPHLIVGFNLGVPSTRKAYRQRLGRIGRSGPGVFIVIAPPNAFRRYGTSFEEYHQMSVEPSYLYLDNRFMQFAHGRCLADELDALGASTRLPTRIRWPAGFKEVCSAARPGGNRPPEFDAIAELGGDTPQRGYPLRNVGELSFDIKRNESAESFGQVNQTQATRVQPICTWPGHMKVVAWHTNAFTPFISAKPGTPGRSTQPRIRTWVNAGLNSADLQDGHLVQGENGFLAECQMQITERVEGYVQSGEFRPYQDLQQRNPNMRARSRNFRTTGVVFCIDEDWFKQGSVKQLFVDKLRDVFVHEHSVLKQDVGSAATNISVRSAEGGGQRSGCVAVFDQTYGSLRLTERLYLEFDHLLNRLLVAAKAELEQEGGNFQLIIEQVRTAFAGFSLGNAAVDLVCAVPEGYEQVFTKGSCVCYRKQGQSAVDVEIIQPTLMNGQLMYQVKVQRNPGQNPVREWVSASRVEASGDGDSWEYAWWNRETEAYEEPPDSS